VATPSAGTTLLAPSRMPDAGLSWRSGCSCRYRGGGPSLDIPNDLTLGNAVALLFKFCCHRRGSGGCSIISSSQPVAITAAASSAARAVSQCATLALPSWPGVLAPCVHRCFVWRLRAIAVCLAGVGAQ